MNANSPQQTPAIKTWLDQATSRLIDANIPSARLDAEIILSHILEKNRTYLHAHSDDIINPSQLNKANTNLNLRLKRMPIAYITGHKEFYGRDFLVTPDTLIPRPDSERIIDLLKQIQSPPQNTPTNAKLVDVGTGSGALGITAKLEFPNLDVTLVDISDPALEIARENAIRLNADVKTIRSDLLNEVSEKIDIIIANLPYVDTIWERSSETDFEPAQAIFADEGGLLLIKKLIKSAQNKLKSGGYIILESDPRQHDEISEFASKNKLKKINEVDFIQSFRLNITDTNAIES